MASKDATSLLTLSYRQRGQITVLCFALILQFYHEQTVLIFTILVHPWFIISSIFSLSFPYDIFYFP